MDITPVNSLLETYAIYEHTMIILCTESIVMGVTLLRIGLSLKKGRTYGKSGLLFLSIAMFILSIINFVEYVTNDGYREYYSIAIAIFAASVEMFLLFLAYMSMLNRRFVSVRRICIEVGLIVIFTVPALFVSPTNNPVLFNCLFVVGGGFYVVKLMFNLYVYRRQIKETTAKIESYHSKDSNLLLSWVNHTFYMVLLIGIVSIVVMMTSFNLLVPYNTFLFFAYFYIYLSVIRNIDAFDQDLSVMESDDNSGTNILQAKLHSSKSNHFISSRQKFLDDWIANKGYSVAGVTAGEVAARLNTNRSRLSQYLKNELNTNYYEWIASMRIDDAKKQLIEHPERSISEIALNVGIEDRDNFRRVFQRSVGMSPSAYRKEFLSKNVQ